MFFEEAFLASRISDVRAQEFARKILKDNYINFNLLNDCTLSLKASFEFGSLHRSNADFPASFSIVMSAP